MENTGGYKAFTAGEALAAKRRVKIKAGTVTTPPEVEYSDAGEVWIGVTEYAVNAAGVITVHYDYSKSDEAQGVKRTFMAAGRYKALGNNAEPLGDVARAEIQSRLDYLYTLFVDTVARNRAADRDTVLSTMAEGRQFIGRQALDVGLVDQIGTMETAMEAALSRVRVEKPKYFRR